MSRLIGPLVIWAPFGLLMVWGAGFAFLLMRTGEGIYAVFQTLMSFFTGPAFVLLACGLFWRRATGAGALVGFIGGVATATVLYLLSLPAVYKGLGWQPLFQIDQPYLYYSVWASLVALVLLVAVSLLTRPEPEEKLTQMIRRPRP